MNGPSIQSQINMAAGTGPRERAVTAVVFII